MTSFFRVPAALGGQRLDQVLAALLTGVSRRRVRRWITEGRVFVQEREVRVQGRPVASGAAIRVQLPQDVALPPRPQVPAISVLWEADGLIAIAKPSGIPTEPTPQGSAGVASEQLRAWLHERGRPAAFLAAVHRLDRETSGALLFATARDAAASAGAAFREGRVERLYWALVEGDVRFREQRFDAPIARAPGTPRRYRPEPSGRPARTEVRTLRAGREAGEVARGSLLEVVPHSGRTHQIRVHLAAAGAPVVGDTLYGAAPSAGFGLHATRLRIELSPGVWCQVDAPVSESFHRAARERAVHLPVPFLGREDLAAPQRALGPAEQASA